MAKKKKKDYEGAIYKDGLKSYITVLRQHIKLLETAHTETTFRVNEKGEYEKDVMSKNMFETVDTRSITFRVRFASKVLEWFEENVEALVEKVFQNSRLSTCKYDNCAIILDSIGFAVAHFTNNIVAKDSTLLKYKNGTEYTESLFDLFKFVLIGKGDDSGVELVSTFQQEKEFLPIAIESDDYDIETVLNDIIKVAFALVTFDPAVDCTPSYTELKGIEEWKYPMLIEVLGQCIKYSKSYNPFYVRFMLCRPEIRTKNIHISEEYVIGLQALEFLRFVMNDSKISKFIDKLEKIKFDEDMQYV